MTVIYVAVTVVVFVIGAVLVLRRKGRTVVDNCLIWVTQDTGSTAIVYYRNGRQIVRLGAEVGIPQGGGRFLYVDLPDTMYTVDGHKIPNDESAVIKQRVSRGLKQLHFTHEFSWPESASGQSRPE